MSRQTSGRDQSISKDYSLSNSLSINKFESDSRSNMNSDFSKIPPIKDSKQSRKDSLRSLLRGLGSKESLQSPLENTQDNQLLEVISEKRPFDEASSAARRDSNYIINNQEYGGGLMTPTI